MFRGEWKDEVPWTGRGSWRNKHGKVLEGEWDQGPVAAVCTHTVLAAAHLCGCREGAAGQRLLGFPKGGERRREEAGGGRKMRRGEEARGVHSVSRN